MNVKIEIITPEIAKEYLSKNKNNYRNISRNRVDAYAKDIALGKWEFNGEGIKFNRSGNLVDGQHRLAAIVKANIPVKMLVVYDVDDNVKIYDVAQTRTTSQIAKASGFPADAAHTSVLSAVSILLSPSWRTNQVAKCQVIDYAAAHCSDLSEAARISRQGANHGISHKSACIAAIYCMLRLGKYKNSICPFFSVVNTGFSLEGRDCSPAIVLRNYLLSANTERIRSDVRVKTLFSFVFQAVDDFENHRSRRKLYRTDYNLADRIKNSVIELDSAY